MIYNFYVFNRHGDCLYYQEWHREKPAKNLEEEKKLMYGYIYSLKAFVKKSSPSEVCYILYVWYLVMVSVLISIL